MLVWSTPAAIHPIREAFQFASSQGLPNGETMRDRREHPFLSRPHSPWLMRVLEILETPKDKRIDRIALQPCLIKTYLSHATIRHVIVQSRLSLAVDKVYLAAILAHWNSIARPPTTVTNFGPEPLWTNHKCISQPCHFNSMLPGGCQQYNSHIMHVLEHVYIESTFTSSEARHSNHHQTQTPNTPSTQKNTDTPSHSQASSKSTSHLQNQQSSSLT